MILGPSRSELVQRFALAYRARDALVQDPAQTAYRLFHGHGEGVPGLAVDRLGETLVVTHSDAQVPVLDDVLDGLAELCPSSRCMITKPHRGPGAVRVARGALAPSPRTVLDGGRHFEVEPLAPGNAGLFLDARPARGWLAEHASGRRVLNLFAFTGSLGLAAEMGGAKSVMHVDMQKRALRRIKQNYALNGKRIDDRDLVRADVYETLRRLATRECMFEGIILDPPPQVPGRETSGQDFPTLTPLAVRLLAPGGWLLCFFSSYRKARGAYEADVHAASPHELEVTWQGSSGIDFPEIDPETKLRFTSFTRC